ncbi:MAG: hypothetical protein H6698_04345 [Myxococcales bacterium]|nr:hypothetical protein [Myxococcales bacterium]MCB9520236.1 hypothetical protein [Myxococcales bacterium]MCB9531396.1 hypothetical protein [Myxococcales bacterium]MCB9533531.1 hypothetical protein [Myxococcales bacterium]
MNLSSLRTRLLAGIVALGAVASGCSPGRDPAPTEAAEPADGSATTAANPDDPPAPPAATGAPSENPAPGAAHAAVTEPPPLAGLMARVGFDPDGAAALDDFVHLPPGATGESGEFRRGTDTVRVALIRYPNPRFAAPHVTDIDERRRVLPHPHEAVASRDRFVVHVVARDLATADAVARDVSVALGWAATEAPTGTATRGE